MIAGACNHQCLLSLQLDAEGGLIKGSQDADDGLHQNLPMANSAADVFFPLDPGSWLAWSVAWRQ